ncbi:hypothetical protein FRC07_014370 [Ceratobasidium sp. 392]|nr:hypothetical protein FRC07_014370 [Ceratobasidium sp. 392]
MATIPMTLWTLDGPPEDDSDIEIPPPVPPRPSLRQTGKERATADVIELHESDADSDQDEFYDTPMTELDEAADQGRASNALLRKVAPPQIPPSPTAIIRRVLAGDRYTSTFPGTSQYAQGGNSACGLASMNAIRLAFDFCSNIDDSEALFAALVSQDYIKDAMEIATYWSNETHLEVEPILELPLFARSLQVTDVQYRDIRFRTFSDALS